MKFLILCLLITFSFSASSEVSTNLTFIALNKLHPTQAFIGHDQIPFKVKKIEKKYKKEKLTSYLEKKWTPAIIGPDNKYWIIDHHHLSYALLHSKVPESKKGLFIKVIFDWSNDNWSYFEEKMTANLFLYLKDDKFEAINFNNLPKDIKSLNDNPFRSLAYFAREKGCFKKVNIPFSEFLWGEYFYKQGIRIKPKNNYKLPLKLALKLCKEDAARDLPGFQK